MRKALSLLVVGGGAVILLWAVLAAWQSPRAPSLYALQLESQQAQATATALAVQQAATVADAERAEAFAAALAPVLRLAAVLGVLFAVLTGAGLLVVGGWALWERRRPLVEVPALAVPVDRRALHAGAYQDLPGALLAARVEVARAQPPVPHTWSPHQVYQSRSDGAAPAQLAAPAFVPPSIGEAAERGAFRDGRYILGYTVADGRPLTLEQRDGRSLLIAGQGGSGGTTYLLGSALQELLMPFYLPGQAEPARFILVDYHAHKPGSLAERAAGLGARVIYQAHTPAEVAHAAALFQQECRARIAGKRTAWPLVLLCDEVGNMVDDADYADVIRPLLKTFTFANNAARAVGGKAIVRGHTLQARAWGNTAAVRQSFHARAGMRLDADAAGLLGIRPALAREMIALPAGQLYTTGPGLPLTHAVAGNVKGDDVGRVLDLAGYAAQRRTVHPVAQPVAGQPSAVSDLPVDQDQAAAEDRGVLLTGNWWDLLTERAAEGNPTAGPSTPETGAEGNREGSRAGKAEGNPTAIRLYSLFMAGRSLPECIEAVYGVSSTTGGRKYQAAMQEAQQLLRAEIARRRDNPVKGEAI